MNLLDASLSSTNSVNHGRQMIEGLVCLLDDIFKCSNFGFDLLSFAMTTAHRWRVSAAHLSSQRQFLLTMTALRKSQLTTSLWHTSVVTGRIDNHRDLRVDRQLVRRCTSWNLPDYRRE
jgi:hypothetical protein